MIAQFSVSPIFPTVALNMAEMSGGGLPAAAKWTCVNPQCGKEFPGNLPGLRFCPWCSAEQGGKVQVEPKKRSPKDDAAVDHSKPSHKEESDVKPQDIPPSQESDVSNTSTSQEGKLTAAKLVTNNQSKPGGQHKADQQHSMEGGLNPSETGTTPAPPTGDPGPSKPSPASAPPTGDPSHSETGATSAPTTGDPLPSETGSTSASLAGDPAPPEPSPGSAPPTGDPAPSGPSPGSAPRTGDPAPSGPSPGSAPPTGDPAPSEPSAASAPPTGDPAPSGPSPGSAPPTGDHAPSEPSAASAGDPSSPPSSPTSGSFQGEDTLESPVQETTPVEQNDEVRDNAALVTGKSDNDEEIQDAQSILEDGANNRNVSCSTGTVSQPVVDSIKQASSGVDTNKTLQQVPAKPQQKREERKHKPPGQEEAKKIEKQRREEEKKKQKEEEQRKQEEAQKLEKQRKEKDKKQRELQREEEQRKKEEQRRIENKLKDEEKKQKEQRKAEERKKELEEREAQKLRNRGKPASSVAVNTNPLETESGGAGVDGGGGSGYDRAEGGLVYKKPGEPGELFSGTRNKQLSGQSLQRKDDQDSTRSTTQQDRQQQSKYNHWDHPSPRSDLEALNTKHSIAVTFHCVVPKFLWEWDEKSCMHMRFEGKALGNWNVNIGEFKQGRQLCDGVFEMTCTLNIDANNLMSPKGYKYVVYSPKMVHKDDCFEYLHTFTGYTPSFQNPNRYLKINLAEILREEYHQYDYFVYPKALKSGRGFWNIGQAVTALKRWVTGQSDEKFTPPPTEEMMQQCLLFYLEPFKDKLLNDRSYPAKLKIKEFVRKVRLLLQLHEEPIVQHQYYVNPSPVCIKSIKPNWLEEVVELLRLLDNPKHQFISSVCIAYCSMNCHVFQLRQDKFVYPLLKMLHVQPDLEHQICPNVSYLFEVLDQDTRKKVSEAVLRLCKDAMKFKTNEKNWDWLYVLPLCHFLSGLCKPFASLAYHPEKEHFNARAKTYGYDDLKPKLSAGFVNNFYPPLKPLFIADPMLLYDFIYICPEDDFQSLFRKIPAYLSLTWLPATRRIPFYVEYAQKWKAWLEIVKAKIMNDPIERQLSVATMNAAKGVVKHLFSKLTEKLDHHLEVLKTSISVLLCTLCKIDVLVGKDEMESRVITEAFGMCQVDLQDWVKGPGVIGGSFFGGRIHATVIVYANAELQLWQNILSLQMPTQSRRIADEWGECVARVIQHRVKQVPRRYIIGLVHILEVGSGEDVHPILSSVFMEAAMQAIDQMTNYGSLDTIGESHRIGQLFGRILLKRYPGLKTGEFNYISLDELLSWTYWPDFIKIYNGTSKTKQGLPKMCLEACSYADSQLVEIFRQLRQGDITVHDLGKIKAQFEQMNRLCIAAQKKKEEAEYTSGYIQQLVELRLEELATCQGQQGYLQHLCSRINPSIDDVFEAKEELHMDYRPCKINTLCERRDSNIHVVCFDKAAPLLSFAQQFYVMTKEFSSGLFHAIWSLSMNEARANFPKMSVRDIEEKVWTPAFGHCRQLLTELHGLSMTLANVDRHFKNYRKQELENELRVLFDGVNKCLCQSPSDNWIHHVVLKIEDYRKLCGYRYAANSFLELRDSLNLIKGDFKDVERISKQVSSSMKDQTLDAIDKELVEAGEFLNEFTGEKLECIQQFCKCQEIVQWIHDTTKDVGDLQNFVNVALATAAGGEDDFANDRLSSLRTVGTGFSSLIYKLKKDTGFKELRQRCTSVWTAHNNDKKLPKMLASCNKDLEWYKSVKKTQGSVEVTSFGQMETIQRCGRYTIAGKRDVAMHSIHDVIQLTLQPQRGEKLLKTSYNLDELRDLESKLVLITGSKAENRAAVEQFLDTLHCVCRIAEVLIMLQQVGHIQYIGWRMDFYCQTHLVKDLQNQAKDMEEKLKRWNEEVSQARKRFYELNYYTTHQLLVLRSELGKMKSPGQAQRPQQAQVMTLLQSISTQITPSIVMNVVQQIATQFTDTWEGSGMQKSPIPQSNNTACGELELPPYHCASPTPIDQSDAVLPTIEYSHSVHSVPQVTLSYEMLNEEQIEHFTNVRNQYSYSKLTALKAIEEVGSGDWNDVQNWLVVNGDRFEQMSQEYDHQEDETEEEFEDEQDEDSESGSEDEMPEREPLSIPSQSPVVSSSVVHSQTRIVVTLQQPVDETNLQVQLLLDAEMGTPEQCVRAIEMHGTAHEAMDHMMEIQIEEDDGFFQGGVSIPTEPVLEEPSLPSQHVTRVEQINISLRDVEDQYLNLNELGEVLNQLRATCPATLQTNRTFLLKSGQPHLLVVPQEQVLKAALSIYMEDNELPLPTPEEMLICDQQTTFEEVNLLWQRATFDPEFKRIPGVFCLVHAEKLTYQTADKALHYLTEAIQGRARYCLVIICSSQDEEKSHIISKLHLYRRPYGVPADIAKYRMYLRSHFVDKNQPHYQQLPETMGYVPNLTASIVDIDRSCVRVVSSTRAGMGKTLFIIQMSKKLQTVTRQSTIIRIPIHGPQVTTDSVMESLVKYQDTSHCAIFHFDISPSVLWQMDTILFSLLVQQGLCDSLGRVWRNHSTHLYAIEVTIPESSSEKHTIPEQFTLAVLEMLPSVNCVKPQHTLSLMTPNSCVSNDQIIMDQDEFGSATFQRVYQYLRRHTAGTNLDRFSYTKRSIEGTPYDCLKIILSYCGVKDPSWAEIRHFVNFLDLQLQSCERSYFCNEDFVGDVMAGLKSFVVKFMIRMSRDFSTSSLMVEVAKDNDQESQMTGDVIGQYQIVERKKWEQSPHPYIFFNQDKISITFVGFKVTKNGDLIDPTHSGGVLERGIMTQQLYTGLKAQRVNFEDDYHNWAKDVMIQKILTVMGIEWDYNDPDPTYVLTVDNLIKILAIQMRFRCGIPVVLMGETGCGKTRLIRFMCDLIAQGSGKGNMLILKVHGGTSDKDIIKFLENAENRAKKNRAKNLDTVVFFDEANTTDAIGLIKEIMCDRRLHGNPVSQDLKFIAACNPYRRHTGEMIKKLRSAGLGFYVRETHTKQKLGKVPLRELVYRVIDLPPSMRPLVYDFGQLNTDTERDYTREIVRDHVNKHRTLSQQHSGVVPAVARVLAWSQRYMRKRNDECSFVSLRDVERAMLVLEYFYDKMDLLRDAIDKKQSTEEATQAPVAALNQANASPSSVLTVDATLDLTRSLILSISVCYHARLNNRKEFEEQIAREFTAPLTLSGGADQFRNEIRWCQEVLLESMVLGDNIARNAALRENVFMMAVCVDLRIPLFLVGKPGSSKSLAKSIVADSMRGEQASQNDLLKSFKQVHMFSYQCSQLSTPQSVIEVFNTAKRFQRDEDTTKYVSVVVLDEVGLAEDSPNLPLKALHPLLEDGTEGADEIVEREKRVAFIGISNWALDPAKMNRGVMVTRGDPDVGELVVSAEGICHNENNSALKERLSDYFTVLAEAYLSICKKQTRQFFGLRDFYSLIKMLYWMCEKTNIPPTGPQLVHAIKRNFGGLREENLDPEKIFWELLPRDIEEPPDLTNIPLHLQPFVSPDNTRRGLIKTSLRTKETSWHGENRYLLFLTENYAALEILKQYLQDQEGDPLFNSSNSEEASLKPWEMEPFVLFGSSFPRDKEYTQVCRNINQIKICMEIGRTVILLNLENLYESLYDVLNQYYIHHGGNRYVDLGLQTHRVKCRVHDEFKLILIAEKTTVYEEFPTPLINRLEKHFVLYSSVLEEWQTEILHELEDWIKAFSDVKSSNARFKEKDAFVGYQKDVAAAVVFQASSQLRKACDRLMEPVDHFIGRHHLWQSAWEHGLLGKGPLKEVAHQKEGSDTWKQAVFLISQFLLLQTTPPSALVRLEKSSLISQHHRLNQLYRTQHHCSIDDFLNYHLSPDTSRGGLLLQVTTHSHLLSSDEVDHFKDLLEFDGLHDVHSFLLQEFDTELDFTSKVSPLFVRSEVSQAATLLIIQCDSGHLNGDLIACARYRIYDVRAKALLNKYQITHTTHVLFIIHLPVQTVQSSFVGFQGDPWISCHIDELRPSEKGAITLEGAQGVPMSILFYGGLEEDETKAPELQEQTSDFTSNVEGMVFERMRSAEGEEEMEEMEEGERETGRDERVVEVDMEVMDLETEEGTEYSTSSKESSTSSQMEEPMEGEGLRNDITEREGPVEKFPPVSDSGRELQPVSEMHTQCVRLNSCIQAAASRLQNYTQNKERAAERVKLLIKLIPRKPIFPLEPHSFYAILVSHIHRMLKEREEVYKDRDDWIIQEAMNITHLQTGGTFKNVLARRLDEVIVPCFAMIIAFMDHNCNLNLLRCVQPTPLSKFWLNICASQHAQDELRYVDMVGTQKVVMIDDNFACEFPFYWLVKDLMDCQWDSAQSTGGPSQRQIHRQLCDLVSDSALGEILKSVQDGSHCEELFRRYTHDFVRSVHKCTHKMEQTVQSEYQLIQDCVHHMVVTGDDFTSLDGHVTLVDRIAAVHVVYRANSEYIHWFSQLTSHNPGILPGLVQSVKQTVGPEEYIMLHLYAVEEVLNGLKPPIEAKRESQFSDDKSLKTWLNRLREISYAIESTLSLPSQHPIAIKARLQWQKIRAIQMFTEHVLLNHDVITYAKRLNLTLGAETDFLKCSTVNKVQLSLINMHGQLKKAFKSKDAKKHLMAIRNSCRNFFIEVVSGLCFGQSSPPEDELVAMLLDIVFTEQGEKGEGEAGGEGEEVRRGTRDLTPYKEKKDENPIIRSFLLQLLLEHDTGAVKAHLRTYFDRCQQTRVGRVEVDHELCLLCTQCFEDALDKEYSSLSLGQKMENIWRKQLLSSATDILTNFTGSSQGIISLEVLEAVAKMRYALLVVAELLQLQVNEQGAAFKGHNLYGRAASALLEEARRACTEPNINIIDNTGKTDTTGPIVYLLKLLVRGAGFSCLKKIVMRRGSQMGWLVPQQLGRDDEEAKNVDPFVMYNPAYGSIREEMCAAAYGRDYTELEQRTAALQPQECVSLLLSVYEVYTMSRASTQMSKQLLPEPIEKMNEMIINCKTLPREMKIMARTLVSNEQGGPLAALQVSAGQPGHHRTLSAVVIHAVACLLARGNIDLLCPLTTLLTKPGDMARAYLPTMSEDMLPEVRRIINEGGKFYECPNGHAYFVGECGRPVVQVICPTCGSAIGGQNHVRVANNRDARSTDITQTGHSLGHPDARGDGLVPERSLSPAACCIVRAIMHSALVWISCNNDAETEGLIALVKNGLRTPQELPEFFWGHLERDVQLLARALGKNHEEAAIVLHLVLQNILICNPPTQQGGIVIRTLGTREVRIEWEKQFGQIYIHPILANVEASLGKAMESIMKDDKQDHDPLFYLVYERMGEVVEGSLEPHLWGYRPRITLEHLTRYMQQQKKKFPILKEFLKRETVLRATQYLPDIVQLQRRMFEVFHHRIDHKVARDKTMRNFIEKRHSENVRSEYGRMMDSVQRAWRLVRDQLKGHAAQFGWRIEEEWLQSPLNLDTTLDFFIPTTTGHGACTFALVHYLTYVHNEFIDWCRVKSKTSSWREHKIELPHVHQCHLLNYESQLQSLLLSHCRYSLKIGHAHEISYDLPALEKYILDRFIHGKPKILVDIPQVSYQKDVYTAATFAAVRKKVAPQTSLGARVQMDILRELGPPDRLRKSLDVVEIVLGFLTSGGGKAKTSLKSYLKKLKMDRKPFSEKAKEHCTLGHVLSLWQTLSVGLARVITLSGQEPFHTLNSELLLELSKSQCKELDKSLPKFDLDYLLGILYEFIETYIRHVDMKNKEWGLLDTLPPHLENSNLTPPEELAELPTDITLAQTVATWKYIVHFQAKQRQN